MKQEILQELKEILGQDHSQIDPSVLEGYREKFNAEEEITEEESKEFEALIVQLQEALQNNDVVNEEQVNDEKEAVSEPLENKENEEKVEEGTPQRVMGDSKVEKERLIEQLKDLIKDEKNVGKSYQKIKEIKEVWKQITGGGEEEELNKEYQLLVDQFYYNLNIYKAIQDHDLKRNQQIKEAIIKRLEDLLTKDGKEAIVSLNALKKEWEQTGPVKKELNQELWDKYKDLNSQLFSKFKELKEKEKEEQVVNLQEKEEVCKYIEGIDFERLQSHKDWKNKTKKVLAKQEAWKKIGHVPVGQKDEVWKRYRTACDNFFNKKNGFYEGLKSVYKENKKLKTELCKRAEALSESTNWEETGDELVKIQKEWKAVGPVHQRDEQYLWHRFQTACNTFFESRKAKNSQLDVERDKVVEEKKAVLEEFSNITSESELVEVAKKWYQTNRVSSKKAQDLKTEFKKQLEKKIVELGMDKEQINNVLFFEKIKIYNSFEDADKMLDRERRFLDDKLKKIEKSIQQYENNLGFFKNAKNGGGLLDEVEKNIAEAKTQLEVIESKLDYLDSLA